MPAWIQLDIQSGRLNLSGILFNPFDNNVSSSFVALSADLDATF
jgi:hypothetical protein